MFTTVDSLVGSFSREQLFATTVMCTALSAEGMLMHISPAFARLLKGPDVLLSDCVGANLTRVLGDRYGGERVRLARNVMASNLPIISRSVMRGRQYVSHFHPAYDSQDPDAQLVIVFHQVVEGPVTSDDFERGQYVEAVNNDYGVLSALSRREVEVAALLGHGLDAKSLATTLSRSLETISSHKKSIFAKLGVDNQLEASIIIRRAGLTERDAPRIAAHQRYATVHE
jgi:DNA-binding CsgD family transcriptional regulator